MKTEAIRYHRLGGPEVLGLEEIDIPSPGPGEILVRNTVAGVNLKDIGERLGDYPGPPLPVVPGIEGAAVVVEAGAGVTDLKPGDRVCYAVMAPGSYAGHRLIPADRAIPIPEGISDGLAAAAILKGMTARMLVKKVFAVRPGQTVLVHAAAGGTGSILCQWAKHLGATVIGTVGSDGKMAHALAHGCDHVINYRQEDFVGRVRDLTDGQGVPVVYDSVGRDTFFKSLECLDPLGLMVFYGVASGHPEPLEMMKFDVTTAWFYTRPSLYVYTRSREELLASARELFEVMESGAVRVSVGHRFALRDAADAHRLIESRQSTGSVVLNIDGTKS